MFCGLSVRAAFQTYRQFLYPIPLQTILSGKCQHLSCIVQQAGLKQCIDITQPVLPACRIGIQSSQKIWQPRCRLIHLYCQYSHVVIRLRMIRMFLQNRKV